MTHDRHRPLRDDVRLLGAILGETLVDREGQALFQTVERVRALSKSARGGDDGAGSLRELAELLSGLPVGEAVPVARAFAQFLSLANIAEQHHRTRRRRAYDSQPGLQAQPGSPATVFPQLLGAGVDPDRLYESVAGLEIELVLTAHPTEAARRTTLQKHRRLAALLAARDRSDATRLEREETEAALRRVVLELWETDEIRTERPTPLDEARWGLVVVEQTLWDVVPRFVRGLDRVLEQHTGRRLPAEAAPIRFGSWMGGDRDGNPFVTAEVTEHALLLSRWMAADLFHREIDRLRSELSVRRANDQLRDRVRGAAEPYRALLRELRSRLAATRLATEQRLGIPGGRQTAAADELIETEDLLEPLRLIRTSLRESGCGALAEGRLLDVFRRAACFGMTLVRLDLREDAERHAAVLDRVTRRLGLGSYLGWDEQQRLGFLDQELRSPRPLLPPDLETDEPTDAVLSTFRMASRQPRGALGAYVISMARQASDVLAVRLLQKELGVRPALRIVPLFETEADLRGAGTVLERLFAVDSYRTEIDDRQEVMIGYSDSAKDSGRLAAAWALYRAQEEIVEVCRRHGVRSTLFHGRGGTVGRGGGPVWLAIRSQPPGSIEGSLRVTEQGEMIEAKFGIPEIASRTLELYVTGVLSATLQPEQAATAGWRESLERMAQKSAAVYRGVVRDDPGFLEYFHHATPIEELGHLLIGSRPARRKPGRDVASLRAIPWVFSWTQMRLMMPSWLGVAEALEAEWQAGHGDTLAEMYAGWPFFRSTLDLIEMTLAKTEPRITAEYDARLVPEQLRSYGVDLRQRRDRVSACIRKLSGAERLLESNVVLRRSIDVRNPYVDPINLVQIELLQRLRSGRASPQDERELRHALLVTFNGIAAGMRNTG